MEVTIDLMNLLLAILAVAGLVLIIYLVVTLAKLQQTLREVNRLMAEARGPVNDTLRRLPNLMDQVSEIGNNIEKLTSSINEDVPVMLKDVRQVTTSARESVETVTGAVSDVGNGFRNMFAAANSHSGAIGTATAILGEVVKIVGIFRPRPKKTSIFFRRNKKKR